MTALTFVDRSWSRQQLGGDLNEALQGWALNLHLDTVSEITEHDVQVVVSSELTGHAAVLGDVEPHGRSWLGGHT